MSDTKKEIIEEKEVIEVTEDDKNNGVVTYELKKPIVFGGEEIKSLVLDLDSLTGGHLTKAYMLAKSKLGKTANEDLIVPEFNKTFQIAVASLACKKDIDFFFKLGIQDFSKISMTVQNFLLEE